jgi:hypothetical protein
VWAYIPSELYHPPIDPGLLGNAVVLPSSAVGQGVQVTFKLLSVDPENYEDAPSEGLRRLLQIVHKRPVPRGQQYDGSIFSEYTTIQIFTQSH